MCRVIAVANQKGRYVPVAHVKRGPKRNRRRVGKTTTCFNFLKPPQEIILCIGKGLPNSGFFLFCRWAGLAFINFYSKSQISQECHLHPWIKLNFSATAL